MDSATFLASINVLDLIFLWEQLVCSVMDKINMYLIPNMYLICNNSEFDFLIKTTECTFNLSPLAYHSPHPWNDLLVEHFCAFPLKKKSPVTRWRANCFFREIQVTICLKYHHRHLPIMKKYDTATLLTSNDLVITRRLIPILCRSRAPCCGFGAPVSENTRLRLLQSVRENLRELLVRARHQTWIVTGRQITISLF